MKLLLTSDGFDTEEIVQKCVELVGKPKDEINFVVINEAYVGERSDHRWVLDDLNRLAENFAGSIEFINLLALDVDTVKQRVEKADVVYVEGGNTDYLMSVFDTTGFSKMLSDILKSKVYVGSSAGSMVVGKRMSTEAYIRIYGEEGDYGVHRYLGFVPIALKPHMDSAFFPNNREETLLDVSKDYKGTVHGLVDGSAMVVDGSKRYVIGGQSLKIVDGKKA